MQIEQHHGLAPSPGDQHHVCLHLETALSLTGDPLSRQATSVARASTLSATASSTSRLDFELSATLARRKQDDELFEIMMKLCNYPDVTAGCPTGQQKCSRSDRGVAWQDWEGIISALPVDPRPIGKELLLASIRRWGNEDYDFDYDDDDDDDNADNDDFN